MHKWAIQCWKKKKYVWKFCCAVWIDWRAKFFSPWCQLGTGPALCELRTVNYPAVSPSHSSQAAVCFIVVLSSYNLLHGLKKKGFFCTHNYCICTWDTVLLSWNWAPHKTPQFLWALLLLISPCSHFKQAILIGLHCFFPQPSDLF